MDDTRQDDQRADSTKNTADATGRQARFARFTEFNSGLPTRGLRGWFDRMRADFRLAIISLFGFFAASVVFPFAVFRIFVGDWAIALLDLIIIGAISASLVLAWRFERSEAGGRLLAAVVTAGALASVLGFGISEMWVFAVLVANFLLAVSWFAATLSVVLIGAITLQPEVFADPIDYWTFLSVSVLVAVFSAIFAYRSNLHHESLSALAHRDPLTGTGNRRALREDLTRIVALSRERRVGGGLALIDLDRFKETNDRHGHETGDRILIEFAEIVDATLRASDRCYRFGGDEFVVLLIGTGRPGLESAVAKLCEQIRTRLESPDGPATVSIGATELRPDDTVHDWLARADRALYRAKDAGRDRFEIL